jgi:alpha-amylase
MAAMMDQLRKLKTNFLINPLSRSFHSFRHEYTPLGAVTEFRYGNDLSRVFRGETQLTWLTNFGEGWDLLPSNLALVFIDNHDTQRDHVLTYKESRAYKMATAFGLAWPYGTIRMMSSFAFSTRDQGPPADASGNIIGASINPDNSCGNGWICEHRWRQIANMVELSNVAAGNGVNNWWSNGSNKIAFSRGARAFVAFNNESSDFAENLQTGMPAGAYCDIISGEKSGTQCTGKIVTVDGNGFASLYLQANADDGVLAIHADVRNSL